MPVVANGSLRRHAVVDFRIRPIQFDDASGRPDVQPGRRNLQAVTISDSSPGTTITNTTDGSVPTTASRVYGGPIVLTINMTLSAMAAGSGFRTSPITADNYVINGSTSGPTFVQSNYVVPQSPQSTVSVAYSKAQVAGDLNVAVVGWNDSTATIAPGGVTDSAGNVYTLAAGPTVQSGTATQAIYYAKNIVSAAPGANTVTVKFSTPANGILYI
jgi:hypothetical protein